MPNSISHNRRIALGYNDNDRTVLAVRAAEGKRLIYHQPNYGFPDRGRAFQLDRNGFFVLMESKTANLVFTDPPYNVPIEGHASGLGAVCHREFQAR